MPLKTQLCLLLLAGRASAAPLFGVGVEGGLTVPMGPVASRVTTGGGGAARVHVRLVGPLCLQLGGGFLSLASSEPSAARGNALWGGGGLRAVLFEGAKGSPWGGLWVDGQADVVGTGPDVRFGYELGLGAQLRPHAPLGLGPFVRFLHIVDGPGPLSADAFLLSFGLSVTLGDFPQEAMLAQPEPPRATEVEPSATRRSEVPPMPPGETTTRIEIMPSSGHADRDGDGFIDEQDRCPDAAEVFNGVDDDDGCPDAGEALVVLGADRLELKQPVKFEKVKGTWRPGKASLPMLSAAAIVISLHPELRVRIEVRVEKQATREATLELSLRRAEAVRKVLVELGLDGARLLPVAAEPGGIRDRVELQLVH